MIKELKERYHIDILLQDSKQKCVSLLGLNDEKARGVLKFHKSIPKYAMTPLVFLKGLSQELGVRGIYIKNEPYRFGLKAFKGLGGSYAMFRILCNELGLDAKKTDFKDFQKDEIRKKVSDFTFVTATDGNHGKGVSWAAKLFGCKAYVFMPKGSSKKRAEAIQNVGIASVTITELSYDETVRLAQEKSEQQGWILIQDTAWKGYEKIPLWIVEGYLTMAAEAVSQLEEYGEIPTHVFLQAGVGAMAGSVSAYLKSYYQEKCPIISIVEPREAACIYMSAKQSNGQVYSVEGLPQTIMAGLNCGTPCTLTWQVLRKLVSGYFSCPDFVAAYGMRRYANPAASDEKIISGESGAVTLGLMELLLDRKEFDEVKDKLGLGQESVILLFNTESDTDSESYTSIINDNMYPAPEF